jgi:hypothetical protein
MCPAGEGHGAGAPALLAWLLFPAMRGTMSTNHRDVFPARVLHRFLFRPEAAVRYTDHMDRRITLETPSGRRYDLTPRTRRERVKTLRNR